MTTVIDASALLAFLQGEPGADEVEAALISGATVSAANWSETAQKIRSRGADWDLPASLLDSYQVVVEAVTRSDAERAATLWQAGSGLSLGDRICLAVGERLGAVALTADKAWGSSDRIRQIR